MKIMDLSNNKITGEVPACLLSYMWQILKLSNNNLGGSIFGGANFFPGDAIYLASNNFEGELPNNLSGNLEIMDLHDKKLFGKLNASFWNLPSLLALSVAGNSLTGEIHPSICKLTSLQFLDISDNNFAGLIPNCNNSKLNLQFLNTSGNSLSGFPSDFFDGSYVTALDLRYNLFIGTLDWIQGLSQVRLILLGGNRFEGHITPNNLCHLQYLNVIDLSHNKLSGPLPHCIGGISFGHNEDYLPSSVFGFDVLVKGFPAWALAVVGLSSNRSIRFELQGFTFPTKGKLYTYGYGFFNLMFGIDLSANMLSGEIPWELGNLSHVKSLNLSRNIFTGRIPPTLANMSAIESLDLSHNELSGLIPWELTRLWSLEVFSVAHNNLSGCIPDSGQFASFNMDSYQGNTNLKNMTLGNGCSTASGPVAPPALEDAGAKDEDDDPVLYVVTTSSFVMAFWATVAFSFCHSYGRSAILNL
jgi:Leucine-rich repeat (LRR) protein